MSKFEATVRTQVDLHHRISRVVENLKKLGKEKITSCSVNSRLDLIEAQWKAFQTSHAGLVAAQTEELKSHMYFEDDYYDLCETAYLSNKDELLTLRQNLTPAKLDDSDALLNASASDQGRNARARALPKISLPKFSGEYNAWASFRDLFESMIIANSDVPPVEKLHYLKNNVTGEAARRISNFAITADNFSRAWDALVARYQNKRVLVGAYFEKLFSLKPITKKSAHELKELIATVNETIGGLQALGAPTESWDLFLVYFVSKNLDAESREAWEMHQGNTTEPATYAEITDFLDGRTRALELVAPDASEKIAKSRPGVKTRAAVRVNAAAAPVRRCSVCDEEHYIARCPVFSGKSVAERRDIVNVKQLCYNCLGPHRLSECRTFKRCRICNAQHHTLLHATQTTAPSQASSSSPANPASHASTFGFCSNAVVEHQPPSLSAPTNQNDIRRSTTLLATAVVKLVSDSDTAVPVRVLLDQGSELSFIRESVVQFLKAPRLRARIPIVGVGSHSIGSTRGAVSVRLRSRLTPVNEIPVFAYVLPVLTGRVPSTAPTCESWPHLRNLSLADPTFAVPARVDLILGADVLGRVLRPEFRRGSDDEPTAQDTIFGWIAFGPTGARDTRGSPIALAQRSFSGASDTELLDLLRRFWEQEEVPSSKSVLLTRAEEQCEQHFCSTHSRDSSGRYIVRLPFRFSVSSLGSSHSAALRSLHRVQRCLSSDSSFSRLYIEFMQEYESLRHMNRLPNAQSQPSTSYFLPHHGVLRESSDTTKLRVVFNGSSRTSTGVSLNECLHVGPKLQQDIAIILLRWRQHRYVFCADIAKMYRQIAVHPDDRRYQQILWSTSGPPLTYQLTTVTYGLGCAPYLAIRVLHQLAHDEEARYPLGAHIIRNEMYVDDVLSGADSVSLASTKANQLDQLLTAGGFSLHKWTANEPSIINNFGTRRCADNITREFPSDTLARALGLVWQPTQDRFQIEPRPSNSSRVLTKRSVLSSVAQIFDPLGWISPVTIVAKIFLQEMWKLKLDWDDPLPRAQAEQWTSFSTELQMTTFSIPRWLGYSSNSSAVELHGFSDASQLALGAVIYLRVVDEFGGARVSLVAAKSKVAPIKKVTIPRLELSAAVLLARLIIQVVRALRLDSTQIHLWVDSTVALTWIRDEPARWKEFVANRVAFVHDTVPTARWHHVAGVDNPADYASRGVSPGTLRTSELWWSGPPWLPRSSDSWPSYVPPPSDEHYLEERTSHVVSVASNVSEWSIIERYSRLSRLLRVTAWIHRAAARFRSRSGFIPSRVLTPSDLRKAELFWLKRSQAAQFATELSILSSGTSLPTSNALSRLAPYVDHSGLLRVGGRLRNSLLDPDQKHPVLLPRDSLLTRLIISDSHARTLHGGVQVMLSDLRQRFWILGGRAPINSFVRRCVRCARYRASAAQQLMGQLPSSRVTPSRAFLNSGVDYAGPFLLRTFRGRAGRTYKGFLVVFVCLATSAVHLEMATDYTTQGFIAAYRRFAGRRGVCASLTSDCGTNFVGADLELRRLFNSASKEAAAMANTLSDLGTEWRFNPPSAPHFGGKWEAAVKAVKFHLRRMIGETLLTYEEFTTLLAQIESILNSRPLCPLSDDPTDLDALTPSHFLVGHSISLVPEPSLVDRKPSVLTRWQHVQQLTQQFWTRWSREYLQRLQDISKWRSPSNQISVGTMVLIIDERLSPARWLLGRVIEVHAGSDGLVRVASVRTAKTVFKRPIVKLCPLPVSC